MARRIVPVALSERGKSRRRPPTDTVRETLSLHTGIESDDGEKIIKDIKQPQLKVQAQIMEDKVSL